MDKEVLEAKLAALIRCVHRVKTQGISSIEDLDCKIIYAIVTSHLDDFKSFAEEIGRIM